MEIITFALFLRVCCVSLTGFMASAAAVTPGRAVAAVLSLCPTVQQTGGQGACPELYCLLSIFWFQQPGTTAAQTLGREVLRVQSHKQSHFTSRMRRRGKAASRNWSEMLSLVSLFGGSCFMRVQQTSWLPAAGQSKQKYMVSTLKTRWAAMRK